MNINDPGVSEFLHMPMCVCVCVSVCVLQVNLCEYSILMLLGHCFRNANL